MIYRIARFALIMSCILFWVVVANLLSGCAEPQLKAGVYEFKVKRTVTEDWCYLDGKKVRGWWRGWESGKHEQCISLKAPFPFDGTLVHENRHMDLYLHTGRGQFH